jgi:ubiquinone/menaquinone biosynthesis C-methylase UbiE
MDKRKEQSVQSEYAHGHHPTVLKSHLWRTLDNSCAYVLPHIKPSMKILDVGCGPGNLTCDFAKLVPEGEVIGLDRSEDVLNQARNLAESKELKNVSFALGNIFSLDYPDGEFDIVHTHQVLQHVGDASSALREMRRVTKPGGIVAARDMTHFLHWPSTTGLELFNDVFFKAAEGLNAIPGAGKMYRKFAREAGFAEQNVVITASTWCYASKEELDFWCGKYIFLVTTSPNLSVGMWKDRVLNSDFKTNAIKMGIATEDDLKRISKAWGDFASTEDAWFTVVHSEMLCTK